MERSAVLTQALKPCRFGDDRFTVDAALAAKGHPSVVGIEVSGADLAEMGILTMEGEKVIYNSSTERIDHVRISIVVEYAAQLEGAVSGPHA